MSLSLGALSLAASGCQTGENPIRVEPGDHVDEERAKREADVNLPGEAAHTYDGNEIGPCQAPSSQLVEDDGDQPTKDEEADKGHEIEAESANGEWSGNVPNTRGQNGRGILVMVDFGLIMGL